MEVSLLKRIKCFPSTMPEEFKTQHKSFSKTFVFKMFSLLAKPAFSNSSGLKSVFEKLRFREGFV